MRHWWERYPGLLDAELSDFLARGLEFHVKEDERRGGRIVVHGSILHGTRRIALVVVYPDTFPFTPPQVYAPDETLDRHQNPFDKNLCVLPYGSENWRSDDPNSPHGRPTAAELISVRLRDLLTAVDAGGEALREAEVPQGEPFTEYFHAHRVGCILVPAMPDSITDSGTCVVRFRDKADWLLPTATGAKPGLGAQALLSEVLAGTERSEAPSRLIEVFLGREVTVRWARVDPLAMGPDGPAALEYAKCHHPELLKSEPVVSRGSLGVHLAGMVFSEEVTQGVYRDGWTFLWYAKQANLATGESTVLREAFLLRGFRCARNVLRERVPEFRALGRKAVAMIGLGAIGAGTAVELARSVVGEVRLIDRDFVEPGNAVRWEYGFGYAGLHKVDALADFLRTHYPHTRVSALSQIIGQAPLHAPDKTELAALENWAEGADILVDASAEDNVSYVVSMLGQELGIPQVYAYSIEGYGGVVARVRPGQTGCFQCLLLAERDGLVPRPRAPEDAPRVQPVGCSIPTFQAPNLDLAPIQTEAARVVVSTLCEGADGYPPIQGDVFTYQLRDPQDRRVGRNHSRSATGQFGMTSAGVL